MGGGGGMAGTLSVSSRTPSTNHLTVRGAPSGSFTFATAVWGVVAPVASRVTLTGHSTSGWKLGRTVMVTEVWSWIAKGSVTDSGMTCEPTSARVGVQLKVLLWGCTPENGSVGVKLEPAGRPPLARVTTSVASGSVPLNTKEIDVPGLTSKLAGSGESSMSATGGWLVLGTMRNSVSAGTWPPLLSVMRNCTA